MESSRIIFGVIILLVGLGLLFVKLPQIEKIGKIAGIVGVVIALATFLLPTSSPPCYCQRSNDEETVTCLIESEALAVNSADIDLIKKIFLENALVARADTPNGRQGVGPLPYYQEAFETLTFAEANHFDIHAAGMQGGKLYYTSGSQGFYSAKDGSNAGEYKNLNPSDHWTFSKNGNGCWAVQRFEFNASHIMPFPPID